jgi:tRNA threonylcarbamoyl adenosine modification protein (Sua5/YciO/YrdC/YwlC family)
VTIGEAVDALGRGQVVGVPTDTVYGLAIDPFNQDAVSQLFELKGRPQGKPVGLLVASRSQAEEVSEISGAAAALADEHWPGALTLVVTPRVVLSDWVGDTQRRTLGVRVPDHDVTRALLEAAGPLAVTSANLAGEPEVSDDEAAKALFGDRVAVYVKGTSPGGVASTVVDATGPGLTILRQGAIDLADH